jgi:hypothetical protein
MSLRGVLAAGLLLLAVRPAPAQTALAWKFQEGDKFYIESVTETRQTITVGDKATTSDSTVTTVSSFVVRKAEAGSYTLEQSIEGVRVKSGKPDDSAVSTVSRFANLLKGATFKFTISPSGKVTSPGLEGYEDLVKKLGGGNENVEKSIRALLPESVFKEDLNSVFGFLPDKGSADKGGTWTRKESLALPWGPLTGEATYTYQGPGQGGEQIDVSRKLTYALPTEPALGVKVAKGDLKVTEATAAIVADPAAGRLISHKQTTHVAGKLTATTTEAPAKEISFDVDETTTRTIKRVEQNPLK